MVSRAGRELLKNTIRTVDHHNRVLEEQIMWDLHRKKSENISNDEEIPTKKRKRPKIEKLKPAQNQSKVSSPRHGQTQISKKVAQWDHSGYLELYPEAAETIEKSQTREKKQRHLKSKDKKKKRKKRKKELDSSSSSSSSEDGSSSEEVWVEKTS